MEDGYLSISNNYAKHVSSRSLQQGGMALYWHVEGGAKSNSILYTVMESVRTNKLNVYEYLKHLLTKIPNSQYLENPEVLDWYLP